MKTLKQPTQSAFVKVIILAALVVVISLVIGFCVYWAPERTVLRKQTALFKAAEGKKIGRLKKHISHDYHDRWGFSGDDLAESIMDARNQFLAMSVLRSEEQESLVVSGGEANFETLIEIGGTPSGPAGLGARQRINQLGKPFIFTWKKESFLPSSWRLVRLENEAVPDDVWGYEPGQLTRMAEEMEEEGIESLLDRIGE